MYQSTTLIGNLGNDPEHRYTQTGTPVTSFSLAVNRSWTNSDGQKVDKVVWFRVTAWRKLAEVTAEYLTKGRQVMVVGEIEEPSVWADRDDNHRASLEITAREVKFLGSPNGNNNGSTYQDNGAERPPVPAQAPVGQQSPVGATPKAVPATAVNPIDTPESQSIVDADIPF